MKYEDTLRLLRELERKKQYQERNKVRMIHEPEMSREDIRRILLSMEIVADNGRIELDRHWDEDTINTGIYSSNLPEYTISYMESGIFYFWVFTVEPTVDGYHSYHKWTFERIVKSGIPMLRFQALLEYRSGGQLVDYVTVVRISEDTFKACKTHSIGYISKQHIDF